MNKVALLMYSKKYEEENRNVKEYLCSEFEKNGITVVKDNSPCYSKRISNEIKSSEVPILIYDLEEGITTDFEKICARLIKMNIQPIVLVTNADSPKSKEGDVLLSIAKVFDSIDPSLLNLYVPNLFYFENKTGLAYRIKTTRTEGIMDLVDFIEMLVNQPKFFCEEETLDKLW